MVRNNLYEYPKKNNFKNENSHKHSTQKCVLPQHTFVIPADEYPEIGGAIVRAGLQQFNACSYVFPFVSTPFNVLEYPLPTWNTAADVFVVVVPVTHSVKV